MKRLYDWVLEWATSPYASVALFIFAFIEAIFFPVPVDILLIVLVLGFRPKAFRYAMYTTVGSVSGAFVGYLAGHYMWVNASGEFTWFASLFFNNIPGFSADLYEKIKIMYAQWDFWIIFTAGFTPVPYKIFTVTAGVFDMNLLLFLFASLISRGARFFLVTFLLYRYGPKVKVFIEKYFNVIALGFAMSLIGGLVIAKLII
ncbi:MAG: DedA family protein [Bacteroidales bacterium]|nr:DedA family protein [Bacteroidales bacterium]